MDREGQRRASEHLARARRAHTRRGALGNAFPRTGRRHRCRRAQRGDLRSAPRRFRDCGARRMRRQLLGTHRGSAACSDEDLAASALTAVAQCGASCQAMATGTSRSTSRTGLSITVMRHGAEEAAKWGYALDSRALPENRAVADYNLACFYARNGHAEDALPLLGAALRARPDLRAYASRTLTSSRSATTRGCRASSAPERPCASRAPTLDSA